MAKRRLPKGISFSPQEQNLISRKYGSLGNMRHPHHLASYEDKLQQGAAKLPIEDRLTCSSCKTLAPTEHILEHAQNPDTPSMQKIRAPKSAKNSNRKVLSDAQFTQTEIE